MEDLYIILATIIIYGLYFVIMVRRYRVYSQISTKVVVIFVSSLSIGYLLSELQHVWSIHLMILLVLFVFGLFFYTWKLYRQLNEKQS